MLPMIAAVSSLFRLLPSVIAGATAWVSKPGDTDMMAAAAVSPASIDLPRPGDPRIDRSTFRLGTSEYMRQETTKTQLVLHFTAGSSARGAFESWRNDGRTVATAYIVDLNGTIFETFDPRYWSHALGVRHSLSRQAEQGAVQIEIVGWGPLRRVGNNLCSWPKGWTNRYCSVSDTPQYVQKRFRGEEYFSAFPMIQVDAVAALCRYLCRRFDIPADVPPIDFRGVANVPRAAGFRGIVAHENYRQDKWDVGPAFPWDRFQAAIRSGQ